MYHDLISYFKIGRLWLLSHKKDYIPDFCNSGRILVALQLHLHSHPFHCVGAEDQGRCQILAKTRQYPGGEATFLSALPSLAAATITLACSVMVTCLPNTNSVKDQVFLVPSFPISWRYEAWTAHVAICMRLHSSTGMCWTLNSTKINLNLKLLYIIRGQADAWTSFCFLAQTWNQTAISQLS